MNTISIPAQIDSLSRAETHIRFQNNQADLLTIISVIIHHRFHGDSKPISDKIKGNRSE